jgi:hypothetical protein
MLKSSYLDEKARKRKVMIPRGHRIRCNLSDPGGIGGVVAWEPWYHGGVVRVGGLVECFNFST